MFSIGDAVQRKSDRSKVGTIARLAGDAGGEAWYAVEFMGKEEIVPARDLVPYELSQKPEDLLRKKAFGDRDDLLRLLTFHKLNSPVDNTLYSLQGSRTEFYPHQYKPLLKFLASNRQKLLIANEVGLGKTIEAGLIMIEQRQRDLMNAVMIVCPSSLCLKWRDEMWRRFDEEFSILRAADFRRLLDDLVERETMGRLRAIISLESLRNRKHLELLEATRPHFDLLIVDEAHHLRNRETLSHRVCLQLAEVASAVLLLTATPIQLGEENLFHLFRVLDSAEFDDFEVFEKRIRANEAIVESQRLARTPIPLPSAAIRERLDSLDTGAARPFFADNPLYQRVRRELVESPPADEFAAAQLRADLDQLNLLGDVFTRSKKRDVQIKAPKRTAIVERPQMSAAEAELYEAITDFVRDNSGEGIIGGFAVMAAQRQAASCLPAARDRFLKKAWLTESRENEVEEHDLDMPDYAVANGRSKSGEPRRVVDAATRLGDTDTKYERLKEVLRDLETTESGRKVLVFAFYKGTLRYLHRRLAEDGFRCEIIHGDVPSDPRNPEEDERTNRMHRFRDDPDVQVLLSSEVGSEGLDFQFCHILVNYDLPWNPMRVEQRIGRIDRLGQKSDRVIIYNFSIPDTIEDRVLTRLYERIGIFERSIGDLETILGEEIRQLQLDLLTQHLTPEEEETRIEEAARAVENQRAHLEKLEQESAKFVGVDAHLEQELERIRQGGEMLTAEDKEAFFRRFLTESFPAAQLTPARAHGVFRLRVPFELEAAVMGLEDGLPRQRFLKGIKDHEVLITFSAERAYEDDSIEFANTQHPLVHLAVRHFQDHPEQLHPTASVRLTASAVAPADRYVFSIYSVDVTGGRRRKRIESIFIPLSASPTEPLSEEACGLLLGEVVREAAPVGYGWDPDEAVLDGAILAAEAEFVARLEKRRLDLEERNEARVQTRLASLAGSHSNAIGKQQHLLHNAQQLGRDPRYLRMLEGTIRNMERRFESRRSEIELERSVAFSAQCIGCGVLEIGGAS